MNSESFIELVVRILTLAGNGGLLSKEEFELLGKEGYSYSDITNAFLWISRNLNNRKDYKEKKYEFASHRVFHETEKRIIPTECRGFLLQLREFEVITGEDLEIIIEMILNSRMKKIELIELKNMIISYLKQKSEQGNEQKNFNMDWNERIN